MGVKETVKQVAQEQVAQEQEPSEIPCLTKMLLATSSIMNSSGRNHLVAGEGHSEPPY
jgi:hypothetical protein